jgi:hypothetical protein
VPTPCREMSCGAVSATRVSRWAQGVELVAGLGAGFERGSAGDPQHPDGLHCTDQGLRCAGSVAVERGSSGGPGISRVRLAVAAWVLTVRAVDPDNGHTRGGEGPGQPGAPCAGAFNADRVELAVAL